MSAIRIYEEDEPEYKLLRDFCDYLNDATTDRYRFFMRNILFDAGQNWWYTAVISEDTAMEAGSILQTWQTCTPACYALIMQGREYFSEAAKDVFKIHSFTNPPSSTYDLTCVSQKFGGSALPEQVRGGVKVPHTLVNAVEQALELGIFSVQEGDLAYGCVGMVCHVHNPAEPNDLRDMEFYFREDSLEEDTESIQSYLDFTPTHEIAETITNTLREMTACMEGYDEGIYYLKLLRDYLDPPYWAAIDEAIHTGEEAAKEWENDYEEEA